jgi:hypothetical protein
MKRLTVSLAAVIISIRHKKEAIFCIMEENLSNTKQRYRVKSSFTLRPSSCFDKARKAV